MGWVGCCLWGSRDVKDFIIFEGEVDTVFDVFLGKESHVVFEDGFGKPLAEV